MRLLALAAALSLAACDASAPAIDAPAPRASARYVVTFDATWSAATHPEAFPPSPHFSPLTGAAHADGVALWTAGEIASDGVRRMAETGATDVLRAEVEALGARAAPVEGGHVGTSPGTATVNVTVTDDRPLVTVVTMLAPSPDWFVGVSGLDLRVPRSAGGDGWAERVVLELRVYDAGTDDGTSYTAPNAPRTARAPITPASYAPLAGTVVGTLTVERVPDAGN